jgi:hypothetical protein
LGAEALWASLDAIHLSKGDCLFQDPDNKPTNGEPNQVEFRGLGLNKAQLEALHTHRPK